MEIGDKVRIRVYKEDGTCYRWWSATVESVRRDQIVVVTPAGHRVGSIDGGWTSEYAIRAFYWPDRRYSLLEVYTPDGTLEEIFVNINSPVEITDGEIRFTDYELDVSRMPPDPARVVDEDEFLEAASRYGYSEDFRQACYAVAREAVELADSWAPRQAPTSRD